jgi:hypothetical protein
MAGHSMIYIKIKDDDMLGDTYVFDYTPDLESNGLGFLTVTHHLSRAKRFSNVEEALAFYRQQSVRCPLRGDGKPNRPLTAYTVEFGRD